MNRNPLPVHPFARRVASDSVRGGLFPEGSRVLVAFSGGPDSCALLLALCEAADAGLLPSRPVGTAHFHHGLRGSDADADAAFSASLSARLALPCIIELGMAAPARGQSPNDAARRARYAFLADSAHELAADTIATGHTADDQAETVLLRVLRGTGSDGLSGIPLRRGLGNGLTVVRPMLGIARAEIEAYCEARGVVPRRDPSNEKDRYARARLRKRLPEIAREFNPRLTDALVRLAESATVDADLLGTLAVELWDATFVENETGCVRLRVAPLKASHPALRRRVLLRALRHSTAAAGTSDEAASAKFVAVLESILPGGAVDLPGGIRARVSGDILAFGSASAEISPDSPAPHRQHPMPAAYSILLPLPGQASVPDVNMTITARRLQPEEAPVRERQGMTVDIAARRVHGTIGNDLEPALVVRYARPGDRIAPLGMGGKTRLLRDMMAEVKWPTAKRENAPLVVRADTNEVLWAVGLAQSEMTRVSESDAVVWRLSAELS